jgi:hypothetical protein
MKNEIKDLKVSDTEDIHHMIITHGRKSTTTKEEKLVFCNYTNNTSTGGNIRTNISNRPVLSSERAPSQGQDSNCQTVTNICSTPRQTE